MLALLAALAGPAVATDAPQAPRRAPADDRAFLLQLAEAQRGLAEQLQQLKERIDWLYYEVTLRRDEHAGISQDVRELRDEVKGLSEKSAALEQSLAALRADVAGVDANVSGFRTFSGLFIALVLVLLAVIFVTTVRR